MEKLGQLLVSFLLRSLGSITPELRQEIAAAIERLRAKAAATKSPFDDLVVAILAGLLDI